MSRLLIGLSALVGFAPPAQAQPKDDALPPGAVARLGKVRYRNVGRVFSVDFSPDGKTLLAGAWDGSIRLWDVATGEEVRQYVGHTGWVRSVAFSPDGKTFASGGKDKVIRLWETATGKELRRLEGHRNWVQNLAFSPDGKTIASRSTGQDLRLWDVTTGWEVRRMELQPYVSDSLAFSPDGKRLAYPNDIHTIALVDIATGKELWRISRPRSWFDKVIFSPDGQTVTGISSAGTIHFWDAATGKELRPLGELGVGITGGSIFSPNGRWIVSTGGNHTIRVWEVPTRQECRQFRSPDNRPSTLAYAPDGRTLAQGSEDISVLLWDVTGMLEKGRLRPTSLSPKELQSLWADLERPDAAAAQRAIWKFAAGPKESIPFLQKHLRPVAPVDARLIARLVADLDSDQFEMRKQATAQLEKMGDLAVPVLRKVLQPKSSLETRRRIERLLEKVAVERENPSLSWLRIMRALEALEHMDSPAARQTLEELAKGAPGAELTEQAKASLRRLDKLSCPKNLHPLK
jgi:Tol biopolymer transport system component